MEFENNTSKSTIAPTVNHLVLMAYTYENGIGCTEDPEKALSLYEAAAQRGHQGAKTLLSLINKSDSGAEVVEG